MKRSDYGLSESASGPAFAMTWISPRVGIAVIALLMMFALFVAQARAEGPYLTSDQQVGVTKYRMALAPFGQPTNFGAWAEGAAKSGAAWFNLESVPDGKYKGQIQAGGDITVTDTTSGISTTAFKWSSTAPFDLSSGTGSKPTGLKSVIP